MSLRKRIQILLAFLVGIPLLVLLFESYQTGRRTLITEMKLEARQIAELETAKMDLTFDPARLIVEGMVRAAETSPQLDAAGISSLLRRTLHENPDVYGVCIAFDPELTSLGRFAPYFFRKDGGEVEMNIPEYTSDDWYTKPAKSGAGKWSKMYIYEKVNTLMVSYSAPIRREGRVVGVAGVDLDLDSLLKSLHTLKPGGEGKAYLVNLKGRILAHPDLKPIADPRENDEMNELVDLIKGSRVDTVAMLDPVSHIKSWIVESPIKSLSAARGGGDWSLIVSWPLEKRMSPLNGMVRRLLVLYLFLGGAAIWFLNRFFDDTITRPLRKLAEQANNYAEGKFGQPAAPLNDAMELRDLGQALNVLGANLKKNSASTDTTDSP
ncbi:MAG: cache domain-containing protein [Verrucomicrobiae bacterium]